MRELVREDRFELQRREAGERAHRQQHDRFQPADHRRDVDGRGLQQHNGTRQVQRTGEPPDDRLQARVRGRRAVRPHPADREPPAGQPQSEDRDSCHPAEHDHRHPSLEPRRRCHARGAVAARRSRWVDACRHYGRCSHDGRITRRPGLGAHDYRRFGTRRLPVLDAGGNRQRRHQHHRDRGHDVADVRGALAKQAQRDRGGGADEGPLPDEMQKRPSDRLNGRFTQQCISRGHPAPPGRRGRRSVFEFRSALPPTRAWSRAPASPAWTPTRRTPGRAGRARAAAGSDPR